MESVGFTGTRRVRPGDEAVLARIVGALGAVRVVTGGCVGVDAVVAALAHQRGLHVHTVLPANRAQVDPRWREHCRTYEKMPDGTDYRGRNERLVRLSDRLVAVLDRPYGRNVRSGTEMTINIARRSGKRVDIHVLHP